MRRGRLVSDSAGLLTDAIGGAAQRGADAYEMNVVMRQLSLLPVRQQLVSWAVVG